MISLKYHSLYAETIGCRNEDEVFSYLMNTLGESIQGWDYFVDWQKVRRNTAEVGGELEKLNALVGKKDPGAELKSLLRQHPSVIRTLPTLVACREKDFSILSDIQGSSLICERYSLSYGHRSLSEDQIDRAHRFASEMGILELFSQGAIRSVPDYVLGVEVGLDSNGRKNRGGTAMESLVASLLAKACKQLGISHMAQATKDSIRTRWGLRLEVDKSSRRFDAAINNHGRLYLMETNYYTGGGSKLKATAGEYRDLFTFLAQQGVGFIWITDGLGWRTTAKPLRETFDRTDHVLNLNMAMNGVLSRILADRL